MRNIIKEFYTAFQNSDAENMIKYYHDDVVFQDPAFGKLTGERAKNMWRMLCTSQKGKNFKVIYKIIHIDEENAEVKWEAFYKFTQTGRIVHNKITASFILKNGLIIKHSDKFNLYTWSRQALGLKGFLVGYSSFFRKKLNQQTNKLLDEFENIHAQKSL